MYIKKYKANFSDISNNKYEIGFYIYDENAIDIWIDLGDGRWFNTETSQIVTEKPIIPDNSTEITLEGTPIEINYTMGNEAYKPLRYSGASIKLLLESPLFDLYQGEITKVMVKVLKNDELYWSGFVTPCVYNSPYSKIYDEFSLEVIDRLSALQYIEYQGGKDVKSAYEIIKFILSKVNYDLFWKKIYVQKKLKINNSLDILNSLFIQERNFYDEEEEALKCNEVFEYIMQYLGLTMQQWGDNIYIVDMDDVYAKDSLDFNVYSLTSNTPVTETIQFPTYTLKPTYPDNTIKPNEIDCGEDTCNVELDEVYNKVTVVGNLLEYSDMIENITSEKYTKWLDKYENNVAGDLSKLTIRKLDTDEDIDVDFDDTEVESEYLVYNAFYKIKSNSNLSMGFNPASVTFANTKRLNTNPNKLNEGVFYQISYKELTNGIEADNNPRITTSITYINDLDKGYINDNIQHLVEIKDQYYRNRRIDFFNRTPAFFNSGKYLVLDLDYKLSNQPNYEYANHFWDVESASTSSTTYFNNTEVKYKGSTYVVVINCILKIGDYYYKRNYIDNTSNDMWYNYWNTDYDTEKTIRDFKYTEEWTKDYSTFEVLTLLKDGDDFNNLSLTNEVSYTFNNTTESGALIKIPFNLQGEIEFAINDVLNLHRYTRTDAKTTKGNRLDGAFPYVVTYRSSWGLSYYTSNTLVGYEPQPISDVILNTFHLTNVSLRYVTPNASHTDFVHNEKDLRYTNVINENYVKEAQDITLYLNTYDFDSASYSFALIKKDNQYKYLETIDDGKENKIQEHRLVEKFVNHYSEPKCIYSNTLMNTKNSNPFIKLYVTSLNKTFIATDIDYQLRLNKISLKSSEY